MNGTPTGTRAFLAALGWMFAVVVASPACAAVFEVIDRKPVAHGAEVVLELVKDDGPATYYQYSYRTPAGIDWPFYRMMVRFKKEDDRILFEKNWIANKIDDLQFDENRVSLFHPDFYDCVVVTLEIDPAAPKVYMNRFLNSYGFGNNHAKLLSVDELEITDAEERWFSPRKLRRNHEGTWEFAGLPYLKKMQSSDSAVPLPSMQEQIRKHEKADAAKADAAAAAGERFKRMPDFGSTSHVFKNQAEWSMTFYDFGIFPHIFPKRDRLTVVRGLFSQFMAEHALKSTLAGGPLQPLPPMRRALEHYYNGIEWGYLTPFCTAAPDPITGEDLNLPCFATDYDKIFEALYAFYALCQRHYGERLENSVQGNDDAAFSVIFAWELSRAGLY
ncbi:hypothetical protein [Prosthecobacter sp.]|uniref:hypothetical protein n=1 Tax=Prosthecobacter sp. TaxID=1965333 RepID=UPI003782FAF0